MAAILLSLELSPEAQVQKSYSLRIHEDTLTSLTAHFSPSLPLTPVLVCGNSQCGKSALLESLLPTSPIPSLYDPEDGSPMSSPSNLLAVLVWPVPVQVGERTLLLMKMYGFDTREEEERLLEATRKVLYVLLAGSAVCCLSFDMSNLKDGVRFVEEIYAEMSEKTGLRLERIFVAAESQKRLKTSFLKAIEADPLKQILYRGRNSMPADCLHQLLSYFTDSQFPVYSDTRAILISQSQKSPISAHLNLLSWLTYLANCEAGYPFLASSCPNFQQSDIQSEVHQVLEATLYYRPLRDLSAVKMLDGLGDEELYRAFSGGISEFFKVSEPIVSLAVFGGQGIGKSTLLNRIVEHCTGRPLQKDLFPVKNTVTHTTKDSEFLPFPIRMPKSGHQLMLVDVQGLDTMDTSEMGIATVVESLITAVLTVVSVPCILVPNQKAMIGLVEKLVSTVVAVKQTFGFEIERIMLLFHDKDPGTVNSDVLRVVSDLNQRYFAGNEVVKLLNKPNFSDPSKSALCRNFLSDLMANCDFPKKAATGKYANMKELLNHLLYFTIYANSSIPDLHLSPQDKRKVDTLFTPKQECLASIYLNLQELTDKENPLDLFTWQSAYLLSGTDSELRCSEPQNIRHMVITKLRTEIEDYKAKLRLVEAYARTVAALPIDALKQEIQMQLQHYFHSEYINFHFKRNWSLHFTYETFEARALAIATNLGETIRLHPELQCNAKAGLEEYSRVKAELETRKISPALATSLMYGTLGIGGGSLMLHTIVHPLTAIIRSVEPYAIIPGKVTMKEVDVQLFPGQFVASVLVIGGGNSTLLPVIRTLVQNLSPLNHFTDQTYSNSKVIQMFPLKYHKANCIIEGGVVICLRWDTSDSSADYWQLIRLAAALIADVSVCLALTDLPNLNQVLRDVILALPNTGNLQGKGLFYLSGSEESNTDIEKSTREKAYSCDVHHQVRELRSTDYMQGVYTAVRIFECAQPQSNAQFIASLVHAANQASTHSLPFCYLNWKRVIRISSETATYLEKLRAIAGEKCVLGLWLGLGSDEEVAFLNDFAERKSREHLIRPFATTPWAQFLDCPLKERLLFRYAFVYINIRENHTKEVLDVIGKLMSESSSTVLFATTPKPLRRILSTILRNKAIQTRVVIQTSHNRDPEIVLLTELLAEKDIELNCVETGGDRESHWQDLRTAIETNVNRQGKWQEVGQIAKALQAAVEQA